MCQLSTENEKENLLQVVDNPFSACEVSMHLLSSSIFEGGVCPDTFFLQSIIAVW